MFNRTRVFSPPTASKLIYLSHPCTTHGDIEQNRIAARIVADRLKSEGHSVLNPLETINPGMSHDAAMKQCLRMLYVCDAIYMSGEWWNSEGCRIELKEAAGIGVEIMYEEGS